MDLAAKKAGLQQTLKYTQQTVKQCPHINCQMNRNLQLSSMHHYTVNQSNRQNVVIYLQGGAKKTGPAYLIANSLKTP